MQKSITKRIVITRKGKVRRRATTLGHSRANKSSVQRNRKKKARGLIMPFTTIKKYLHS